MRFWGTLLLILGMLMVLPAALFAYVHYFYTVGVNGPGLTVGYVALAVGVLCLSAGAIALLRARRVSED